MRKKVEPMRNWIKYHLDRARFPRLIETAFYYVNLCPPRGPSIDNDAVIAFIVPMRGICNVIERRRLICSIISLWHLCRMSNNNYNYIVSTRKPLQRSYSTGDVINH